MSYTPKIGERIQHDTTGKLLGTVWEVNKVAVRFDGPRYRDGYPVTLATIHEIAPYEPTADEKHYEPKMDE